MLAGQAKKIKRDVSDHVQFISKAIALHNTYKNCKGRKINDRLLKSKALDLHEQLNNLVKSLDEFETINNVLLSMIDKE